MRIEIEALKTARQWAFYLLRDGQDFVQYAGICQGGELLALPDAIGNPLFRHLFEGKTCVIEVVKFCDRKTDAINMMNFYMRENRMPHMNKFAAQVGRRAKITCNETGETFNTLKEIVAAHGGSESNLSKHINGHSSYKTIKGRTYTKGKSLIPAVLLPIPAPPAPVAVPLHIPQPVTGDKN